MESHGARYQNFLLDGEIQITLHTDRVSSLMLNILTIACVLLLSLRRTDNGTKNRFHHLRRRLGKDYHRQEQKYSNIMVDKPVESTDVDSVEAIQEKTRAVMRVIAVESKRNHYPNIKGYVFGPFVPVTDTAKMCGRCGLMIPSEHTGKTMCTSTGWCEACTRIPPYVSHDQLRECLDMRRTDDLLLSPIP